MKKSISLLLVLVVSLMLGLIGIDVPAEAKTKVSINKITMEMKAGSKTTLYLKGVKKADFGKVKWTTSDKSLAKVTYKKAKGKATVKTIADGDVVIKAKYKSKTYTCKIFIWKEGKNIGSEGDPIIPQRVEAYAKNELEICRGTLKFLFSDINEISREDEKRARLGSPFVIYDTEDRIQNEIYYFPVFINDDKGLVLAVIDLDKANLGEGLTMSISSEWFSDVRTVNTEGMINEYMMKGEECNYTLEKLCPKGLVAKVKALDLKAEITDDEIKELKDGHHPDWLDPEQVVTTFVQTNNLSTYLKHDDNGLVSKIEKVSAMEERAVIYCDGVDNHIELTLQGKDIGDGVMAWKVKSCELK